MVHQSTFDNYYCYYYFINDIKKKRFLRSTFQLVISVSALMSLFLCYSTGFSLFPNTFNVYFSTFLFSFFTHTLERKYMFLICNGILAFLAKSSLFNSSPPPPPASSPTSVFVSRGGPGTAGFSAASPPSELIMSDQMKQPVLDDHHEEEEEVITTVPVTSSTCEEKQEREHFESEVLKAESADDHEEAADKYSLVIQEEEEARGDDDDDDVGDQVEAEGGPGNEDIASTDDELTKKIEEFIRKMKEELRIEAQQQLITV